MCVDFVKVLITNLYLVLATVEVRVDNSDRGMAELESDCDSTFVAHHLLEPSGEVVMADLRD